MLRQRVESRRQIDTPTGFSKAVLRASTVPNALPSGLGRLARPSPRRVGDLYQPSFKKPPLDLTYSELYNLAYHNNLGTRYNVGFQYSFR